MPKNVYNAYHQYIKKNYGGRVQKITIDAQFTCPNRDGSKSVGGCTYCNNETFGTATKVRMNTVTEQLLSGISYSKRRYKKMAGYIAYFQSYSNTYAPIKKLKSLYSEALSMDGVLGLAIGTRADCVDEEKISYLEELAKTKDITIEYGLESMFDESLKRINRCHDYQCFLDAIELTKNRGIKICVHLIIGFPWETKEQWMETARELSKLPIDYIKIHQLHIVKNTVMGNEYRANPYKMLSKDEYIDVAIEFLENLNPNIVVQRIFGSAPEELMLSEHWPWQTSELTKELVGKMEARGNYQGRLNPLFTVKKANIDLPNNDEHLTFNL